MKLIDFSACFYAFLSNQLRNQLRNTNFKMSKSALKGPVAIGFGANYYQQLGQATLESLDNSENSEVTAYSFSETTPWDETDDPLVQVACTSASTLFLTRNGKIYRCGTVHGHVWPSLSRIVIQLPLKCVEIAAGRHFGLARMEGGLAVCSWGAGHFGQLGLGSESAPFIEHPTVIEALLPHVVGAPIATIAAGYWHAMAVTQAGHLYSWGCNRNAQCGMKPTKDPPTICSPQLVRFETDLKVKKVAAGRSHSAALDDKGSVYCWGACQYGQCGILSRRRGGVAPPKHVEALEQVTIVDVAAGDSHTLALTGGGRVFGWGSGFEGQLGTGSIIQMNPKPKLIGDLDFVAIEAGLEWKKEQSQSKEQQLSEAPPPPIDASPGSAHRALANIPKIVSVHATGNCSMAISSSGHAYSWGCNDVGNLGIPKLDPSDLPFVEPGLALPKSSPLRQLHVQSFDSSHNVAIPQRLDALNYMHITSLAASPTFLWCLGTERKDDKLVVGRTLYEIQEAKLNSPTNPAWAIQKSENAPSSSNVTSTNSSIANSSGTTPLDPREDPPEMKDGSEVELEGDTGSFEEGSTSRHSSVMRAYVSQESFSNNEEPSYNSSLPPKSLNSDSANISPSKSKKRFSLKKMAKAVVRGASLNGSNKSEK